MLFSSYTDVERWLDARPQFSKDGAKATDFRPHKLVSFMEFFAHPEWKGSFIHVAGTNGKGTTSSMIAAIYQEAGYKVGLFTSPHIEHWRERIKINGQPVTEDQVLHTFQKMQTQVGFDKLTYFELATICAFLIFESEGVDLSVIETGMGGRLDATNILRPLVSVITSIGLDHTEYLGNTLSAIASEKAGIIKEGTPVVIGDLPSEARQVILDAAHSKASKVVEATHLNPYAHSSGKVVLQLEEQNLDFYPDILSITTPINAAMATQVCRQLKDRFPVNVDHIQNALGNVTRLTGLRARMERLMPTAEWYFDGAHNAEAIQVLMNNLEQKAVLSNWTMIFTMMSDKVNDDVLQVFKNCRQVIYWSSGSSRSARPDHIRDILPNVFVMNEDEICDILPRLSSEFVIFTGSFYFYNEVRRWIQWDQL
jgi:dihydrofolate synthase / folylpolyglutamate synthase